jgi:hypothetical protein
LVLPACLSLCLCAAVTNSHHIYCSWFFWFAFPCVCVQQSPTVITYPALGSSGSPFLVSLCDGHQQSLQHLLADSVCVQPAVEKGTEC